MKRVLSLFLCIFAMACYAADSVDTIRVSINHPSYFAFDEEEQLWMYTGEANQSGKRYVFTLEWYAPAEDMTGTFTDDQIADYTYNGGLIINNMPKLAKEIVAEVQGSRDTAIYIHTMLKAISGIYATDTTVYLFDMMWKKPMPKDTVEYIVPKGELVMKDSAIFRGVAANKWSVSLCYDNYITYFGEKTPGHVFDKNTYLAYNNDTITPLSSPTAVITLDTNRVYHLEAEIFGTDEKLHVIKLDAPIPNPTDTVSLHFNNWELNENFLEDGEWGCQYFGEEYQVEIYIQYPEIKSGTYSAQQVYAYVTEIKPNGAYVDCSAVYAHVVADIRDTCRFITADLQGDNGRLYRVQMDYHLPHAKDTVDLAFQDVTLYDNILYAQNISFLGYTADSLYYMAMNLYTTSIPDGMYTHKDVYRSFILHYLDKVGDDTQSTIGYMLYGTVEVEFDGRDSLFLHAEMLCTDSVFYRFDIRTAYSASKHLTGDTEEGEIVRNYGSECTKNLAIQYFHQLNILNPTQTEELVLWFVIDEDDPDITIPAGEYPINGTAQAGTVYASTGYDYTSGSVSPSLFVSLVNETETSIYFLVEGTVTVEKIDKKMRLTVDALNSFGVKVYIVYDETKLPIEQVRAEDSSVVKRVENGQVVILRNDARYTILGNRID